MAGSKRRNEEGIPVNYPDLLTEEQLEGLHKLESFGWSLLYVRRPKFAPIEVVLEHSDGRNHAILGPLGEIEKDSSVRIRGADEASVPEQEKIDTPVSAQQDSSPTNKKEPIPTVSDNGDKPPPKYLV